MIWWPPYYCIISILWDTPYLALQADHGNSRGADPIEAVRKSFLTFKRPANSEELLKKAKHPYHKFSSQHSCDLEVITGV